MAKKKKKIKKGFLKRVVVSKPILKKAKVTIKIREQEPSPYVSRFFKEEVEEDKRQFYFK